MVGILQTKTEMPGTRYFGLETKLIITVAEKQTLGNGAPGILTSKLIDEYWDRLDAGWLGTRAEDVIAVTAST